MKLDVIFTPAELAPGELADRTVVVIDVLRATTTIVTAFAAGAKAIFPVASVEEALRLANSLGREDVLLCGERRCLPVEGFDMGNSPGEFTPGRVAGKTLVMSTTNGTYALSAVSGAKRVLIAAELNLEAVVRELLNSDAEPVLVCSGRERRFALEDAVCAGEITRRLVEARVGDWELNDAARAALALAARFPLDVQMLEATAAGRGILDAGITGDLELCARRNLHPIVPVLEDRHLALPSA